MPSPRGFRTPRREEDDGSRTPRQSGRGNRTPGSSRTPRRRARTPGTVENTPAKSDVSTPLRWGAGRRQDLQTASPTPSIIPKSPGAGTLKITFVFKPVKLYFCRDERYRFEFAFKLWHAKFFGIDSHTTFWHSWHSNSNETRCEI